VLLLIATNAMLAMSKHPP